MPRVPSSLLDLIAEAIHLEKSSEIPDQDAFNAAREELRAAVEAFIDDAEETLLVSMAVADGKPPSSELTKDDRGCRLCVHEKVSYFKEPCFSCSASNGADGTWPSFTKKGS